MVVVSETLENGKILVARNACDAVILDLDISDGIPEQMVEWIREVKDRIPVIILIGHGESDHAMSAGAIRCILKTDLLFDLKKASSEIKEAIQTWTVYQTLKLTTNDLRKTRERYRSQHGHQ